ncbi:hypothetical protein CBS9595_000235 [Malassezia furfur]|nr:hypothetical protein CBS9595_000235 [Malassezia furfur]
MRLWASWLAVCVLAVHALGVHGFLHLLTPKKPAPQIVGHYAVHLGVPQTNAGAQRYVAPRFQRFLRADQDVNAKTSTAIVVATDSQTYGAVNPRDGGLVWRRYDKAGIYGLYSMGDARAVLGKTGELLWETRMHNASRPLATPGVHAAGDAQDVVVVSNAHDVRRLRAGHIAWHFAPDDDAVHVASTIVTPSHVYVVAAVPGKRWRPRVYVLSALGALEATHDLDGELAHGPDGLLLLPWARRPHLPPGLHVRPSGGPQVVWLGPDGAVHAVRVDAPVPRKTAQRVRARGGHTFAAVHDVGLGDRGYFVGVRSDGAGEVLRVDEDGRLHSAWEFEETAPDAVYEGVLDRSGHAYILRVYFTRSQQLLNQHVFWADAWTGQERGQVTGMSFQYDHDLHGNVRAAPFEVSRQSPYQLVVRAALVTSSGALHLVQDGEHQWVLEEGLAEHPHTLLVAMPAASLGPGAVALRARHDAPAPLVALEHEAWAHRVLRHVARLAQVPRALVAWAVAERGGVDWLARLLLDDGEQAASLRQPTAGGARVAGATPVVAPRVVPDDAWTTLVHDRFGTHEVIVAATRRGKVYGIATTLEGSRLLWQRALLGYGPGEGAPEPHVTVTDVVPMRAAGALLDGAAAPPLVAVVAQTTEPGAATETRIFELNPLTGEPARGTDDGALLCNGPVRALVTLPLDAPDSRTLAAVCRTGGALVVYPPAHTALPQLDERLAELFVAVQEADGVQGHAVRRTSTALLQAVPTWRWALRPGEAIVSMLDLPADAVASAGRVVGDRSVLYKYLNPHGRVITTYTAADEAADVYLLDTVTGALAFHLRVPHVAIAEGLHTTWAENWITVQYATNQTAEHSEPQPPPTGNAPPWYFDSTPGYTRRLVSIDLYAPDAASAAHASSFAAHKAGGVAAYAPPDAYVRSFLLPYGVLATGVTRTALGVANKGLVVATDRDNLVLIPRTVLDPRRPLGKPSPADASEGLFAYTPEIPDEPAWHLTRTAYRILEVRTLQSHPSLLESSAMVLGVGLDWMYTMAAPSGPFDRLVPTFNKLQLVLTIVGLLMSIVVSNPIVRGRRIASRW